MPLRLFTPRRAALDGPGPAGTARDVSRRAGLRTASPYAREAGALVLFASALYVALALASFRGDPLRPEVVGWDWVGPVGAAGARALAEAVGAVAWFVPIELALLGA